MKKSKILLFHAVTIFYWVTAYNYVPYITPYLSSLGFAASMVGLITSMYGFALLICRLPIGIIGNKTGRQKLLVIVGILFGVISAAGMGFTNNSFLFMVFRLCSGISIAFWVIFVTLYSSYFDPGETIHPVANMNILASVGRLLAAFLGASMATWFGYRWTFLLAAVIGAAGLGCAFFIEDTRYSGKQEIFTARDVLEVLHNKELIRSSVLGASIQFMALATVYNFSNTFAKTIGASELILGVLQALINIAGILAPLVLDSGIGRKFSGKMQIGVSIGLMSAGILMYIFCKSMLPFGIAHFVIGLGFGAGQVVLMANAIQRIEPEKRSTAMGFYQAVYGIGIFLGPLVMGFLVQYLGYSVAFFVVALFGIWNVVFVLLSPQKC